MSHYKPYSSYKDSGIEWIGEVPEHWAVIPIKRVASLKNLRTTESSSELQYIGLEDVESASGKYKLTEGNARQSEDSTVGVFSKGNVLYGKLRPYLKKAIVAEMDGICSTEFLVLDSHRVESELLQNWILTSEVTQQIESTCEGAKMPRADWEGIGNVPIPVPPNDEQSFLVKTIKAETIRIDTLIAKKTRFIELLKEKRQALITHVVTKGLNPDVPMKDSGIEWIGDVPETWGVGKLKHFGSLKGGAGFPAELQGRSDNELPFYKVGDLSKSLDGIYLGETIHTVSRDEASKLGAKVFPEDTIVWAKIGAALLLNRRRITKISSCLDNNMTGFIVSNEKAFYKYAFYLMCSIDFDFYVRPGAVPSISEGEQSAIPIPIPPVDEQKAIAETIDRETTHIDTLIAKAQHSIELLKERRSAFITAAVTGQIDCRGTTYE